MAFTDIVTTSAVRTVLGVAIKELPDARLQEPIFATVLAAELEDIDTSLVADFMLAAEAMVNDSYTAAQAKFVDLTQAFSAYIVAKHCLGAIEMFAPMTIKDSRTEVTRISDPYKALEGSINGSIALLRKRLIAAYAVINPAVEIKLPVTRRTMLISGLGLDPVTG